MGRWRSVCVLKVTIVKYESTKWRNGHLLGCILETTNCCVRSRIREYYAIRLSTAVANGEE